MDWYQLAKQSTNEADEAACSLPIKRKKISYSPEQVGVLEKIFADNSYPCKRKLETIGLKLDMTEDRVRVRFKIKN